MATINLDTYFKKVYDGIRKTSEASAEKQISALNAKIDEIKKALEDEVATAFEDRVEMLVNADVIDAAQGKEMLKKFNVVSKKKKAAEKAPRAASPSSDPCIGGIAYRSGC